jgi:hypothetical protein
MKFYLLFIASFVVSLFTFGQKNNGYYGHKGFIQVESVMSYPLFSNLSVLNDSYNPYSASNNMLVAKKDNFNIGFRITAGYAIKRNIALSFEYGQDYSSVYPSQDIYVYDNFGLGYGYQVEHEMLDITTNVFIPKIEFGTSKSLLPMGLSHQIGFGISYSKVKEKDYLYRYVDYFGYLPYTHYSTSSTDLDPINFSNLKSLKRYVILYALSMRSPITKNLMIHYGLKYTLNVGKKQSYNSYSNNSNEYFTSEIMQSVARQRLYSFMSVNIGLTYAF